MRHDMGYGRPPTADLITFMHLLAVDLMQGCGLWHVPGFFTISGSMVEPDFTKDVTRVGTLPPFDFDAGFHALACCGTCMLRLSCMRGIVVRGRSITQLFCCEGGDCGLLWLTYCCVVLC